MCFITSSNDHQWSSWSLDEIIKGPASRAFSVQLFSRQSYPDSVPAPGSLRRFPSVGALISLRHLPGEVSIINLADHEVFKVQKQFREVCALPNCLVLFYKTTDKIFTPRMGYLPPTRGVFGAETRMAEMFVGSKNRPASHLQMR